MFYFSKQFFFQDRIALVGFGFLDWLGLGFGKGSSTTEEKSFMRVKRFFLRGWDLGNGAEWK